MLHLAKPALNQKFWKAWLRSFAISSLIYALLICAYVFYAYGI